MDVTLLNLEGCPGWREVDAHLALLAAEHPEVASPYASGDTGGG